MRRQTQREVEAAARRRLDLLQRELEQAGLSRIEDPDAVAEPPPDGALQDHSVAETPPLPPAARVPPAGRHLRQERSRLGERLSARMAGALADRLPDTLRGHAGLQVGPALLVVGLVAMAVLAGAYVLLRSAPDSRPLPPPRAAAQESAQEPVPESAEQSGLPLPDPSGAAAASSRTSASPSAAATGTVTVDVAGKVRRPGVATLPAGSRVVDALKRAGGARGGTDLTGLNLARVLVDGEQIVVGRPPVPGGVAAGVASGAPPPTGALVNLNTATEEQLDTLPGVGPVTAQKILQWRTDHGAFSSVDELLEIDGIGEKTFADLAPLVTL